MSHRSGIVVASVVALSAALASVALAQRPAVTVITGTLVGADGAPMKAALVHLYRPRAPRETARTPVSADGRYAIATTDSGAFYIQFTGVDHYAASVPLLLGRPATIALDVRLKHYAYTDSLERITAIGDWNHFSFESGRPLVRQSDGRYTLDVEVAADTLAYQLLGLEAGGSRSTNGTLSDRYVYDNGGDYRSIIRTRNGRATIVFDPAALRRVPGDRSVVFRDPASRAARLYALIRLWEEERQAFAESSMAARARRDSTWRYDWAPVVARRTSALGRERDPEARLLLLHEILDAAQLRAALDTEMARRITREIAPSSPWWSFYLFGGVSSMMRAVQLAAGAPDRARADTAQLRETLIYLDRANVEHPDSGVKADALRDAIFLAKAIGDHIRANEYYNRFVHEYPNSFDVAYVNAQFSPNRVMRVGVPAPAFRFASLDDSAVTYSRESMMGRFYLLDFWATWCGPCIGDMPYLHAAHDSLASQGLEILSISLDRRPEDVRQFRTGEWRMPWLHAFAAAGMDSPQMRQLEILFVPRMVLVGREGTILAVDEGLRGQGMTATIRRALEATRAP
jgi:thiol-disulfide isomerase/thioredoxin